MPRYFFDTYNGSRLVPDPEGRELPSLYAARLEAIEDVRELITEGLHMARDLNQGGLQVREDTRRQPLFTIGFKEVFSGLMD